jgi:hypothetical protein
MSVDADLRCGRRFESERWSESIIYIKSLVGPYKKRTLFYFRDVSSFCTPRKAAQTAEWSGKWNRVYIYIQLQISVQTQICVHTLNRHPLTSLSQTMVRFKGILKSESFPNSQIYGRFLLFNNNSFYVSNLCAKLYRKPLRNHRKQSNIV